MAVWPGSVWSERYQEILELHKVGRITKVFPLLLGKEQPADGSRTDYLSDGSLMGDQVSDAHSPLTHAETAKFLQQIDPSLPSLQPQSVRATRDTMLKFEDFNLCTLAGVHGGDQTSRAESEKKRLEACAEQAIDQRGGAQRGPDRRRERTGGGRASRGGVTDCW